MNKASLVLIALLLAFLSAKWVWVEEDAQTLDFDSGIKPTEEMIGLYKQLRVDRTVKFIIFRLTSSLNAFEIVKTGDQDATYDDFVAALTAQKAAQGVIDLDYQTDEMPPRKSSKMILFTWVPITAPIKLKFALPSTTNGVMNTFPGIAKHFQVSDIDDLDYDSIVKELRKA